MCEGRSGCISRGAGEGGRLCRKLFAEERRMPSRLRKGAKGWGKGSLWLGVKSHYSGAPTHRCHVVCLLITLDFS